MGVVLAIGLPFLLLACQTPPVEPLPCESVQVLGEPTDEPTVGCLLQHSRRR